MTLENKNIDLDFENSLEELRLKPDSGTSFIIKKMLVQKIHHNIKMGEKVSELKNKSVEIDRIYKDFMIKLEEAFVNRKMIRRQERKEAVKKRNNKIEKLLGLKTLYNNPLPDKADTNRVFIEYKKELGMRFDYKIKTKIISAVKLIDMEEHTESEINSYKEQRKEVIKYVLDLLEIHFKGKGPIHLSKIMQFVINTYGMFMSVIDLAQESLLCNRINRYKFDQDGSFFFFLKPMFMPFLLITMKLFRAEKGDYRLSYKLEVENDSFKLMFKKNVLTLFKGLNTRVKEILKEGNMTFLEQVKCILDEIHAGKFFRPDLIRNIDENEDVGKEGNMFN